MDLRTYWNVKANNLRIEKKSASQAENHRVLTFYACGIAGQLPVSGTFASSSLVSKSQSNDLAAANLY